jgi:AAA+ superfamily predicted ATPase
MIRFLGIAAAVVVLLAAAYPFGREAYHRYQVSSRLDSVMDASDRAALSQWNGDARSFGKTLFDRCQREQGTGAPACERYRFAFQ